MIRVIVERNFEPTQIANNIKIATTYGTRKVAESLRDKMRDAYDASVHKTDYGDMGGGKSSLSNFIVVAQTADGNFTVGAKKNQLVGTQTIEEIFAYMDGGTGEFVGGRDDAWVFKLSGERASMSDTGFWVTKGQEPKEFITGTASKYMGAPLQADTNLYLKPALDVAFMGVGISKLKK